MKRFNNNFRTKLYESVAEIENNSQAEAVVIIKKYSGYYSIYSFAMAAIACFIVFSILMFIPLEFDTYYMYAISVIIFGATLALFTFVPTLQRIIIPKKIRRKNAEIYARAIFQKGMIYNTIEHTGFLIYCSVTEKEAVFLPDHAITLLFEDADLQKINAMVNNIFAAKDVPAEILRVMHQIIPIFAKYLPHHEDDINELPDDLDVDL